MAQLNKFTLAIVVAVVACSSVRKNECNLSITDFNSEVWKNDTLGCQLNRKPLAEKLINEQGRLIGYERVEIENCLGKPNTEKKNDDIYFYQYFIEGGLQCSGGTTKAGYDSLEVSSIIVFFDKSDKVKSVEKIVP